MDDLKNRILANTIKVFNKKGLKLTMDDVAEQMGISSRGASGTMRKLVNDGFCEKIGQDPVIYSLTEKGKNYVIEGENDGFLTPAGVKHGNFKGIVRSNSGRGISHCDEVDMRRHRFTRKQGNGVSDILDMYREILKTLKEKGV